MKSKNGVPQTVMGWGMPGVSYTTQQAFARALASSQKKYYSGLYHPTQISEYFNDLLVEYLRSNGCMWPSSDLYASRITLDPDVDKEEVKLFQGYLKMKYEGFVSTREEFGHRSIPTWSLTITHFLSYGLSPVSEGLGKKFLGNSDSGLKEKYDILFELFKDLMSSGIFFLCRNRTEAESLRKNGLAQNRVRYGRAFSAE